MRKTVLVALGLAAVLGTVFLLNDLQGSHTLPFTKDVNETVEQENRDDSHTFIPKDYKNLIVGDWSLYLDCPNTIFSFQKNGSVIVSSCDVDPPTESGTYVFTGSDEILATFPETGEYYFKFTLQDSEMKLRLTRFNQEYFFFKVKGGI